MHAFPCNFGSHGSNMTTTTFCSAGGRPPRQPHQRRCACHAAENVPRQMHITSTQNPAVKHCVKLRESGRYRRETGTALLTGSDLVQELAAACGPYRAVVGLEGRPLPEDVAAERFVTATAAVLQKITGLDSVGGVLAAEAPLPPPADLLHQPPGRFTRVLVLDGVQDPGNLGGLLRTALALGWQAAVLLPGCCDPYNDKALRASRGAAFKLPIGQLSMEEWDVLVQQQKLVALAAEPGYAQDSCGSLHGNGRASSKGGQDGKGASAAQWQQLQQQQAGQQQQADKQQPGDWRQLQLGQVQQRLAQLPVCLCLGAEGQGLSAAVRQRCRSVSIPQAGGKQLMESLNVSAAGAILMFALSPGVTPLLSEIAEM